MHRRHFLLIFSAADSLLGAEYIYCIMFDVHRQSPNSSWLQLVLKWPADEPVIVKCALFLAVFTVVINY